jgi:phage baseplate assembly protein W
VSIPHLTIPFQIVNGQALTVEQNSVDEITQCVEVLCATVTGTRLELPAYGIPDQTFSQQVTAAPIQQAIATWEPRAQAVVTVTPGSATAVSVTVLNTSGGAG